MKTMVMIAIMTSVLWLAGCGPTVDSVKDATMGGYEQTTVGKAFDAYFDEPSWELKESGNGSKFVEFTGKFKNDFPLDDVGAMRFAKGSAMTVQFLIKDKSFDVHVMIGVMSVKAEAGGLIELVMAAQGLKPGPFSLNEAGVDRLLASIYQGN